MDSDNIDQPKAIIVSLRRPRLNDSDEMRTDPLWEFGSFGCTGCHTRNLMNPRKIHLLEGARLAFAQGGDEGIKLVTLTPPAKAINHGRLGEVKWFPAQMPFKYSEAPLLIDNNGNTDFPLLKNFIYVANRSTWVGKFASKFRSRRKPLDANIAQEMIEVFERISESAASTSFASTYVEALPYLPPKIDINREQTYVHLLASIEMG